jgi:hypothetical protein
MKAAGHRCQLSDRTNQAANNGGKTGPEVPGNRRRLQLSRRDIPVRCGPEALGRCEVGITTLLLAEG